MILFLNYSIFLHSHLAKTFVFVIIFSFKKYYLYQSELQEFSVSKITALELNTTIIKRPKRLQQTTTPPRKNPLKIDIHN